ncbi:uncharacterized protein BP5553_08281 [Venustampulla echinocandica]|uniref:MFS general substrate transporter n=1 Tax=Venustampulla echinocandica TaxID=2656787 RepID=A0A370TGA1_9HELO|nr:uncharacterized protein BP5553_08281 [Venustampulla echinocandica]RDL33913.1 hypothetical protein BP5553_08281 [Venustampulla echinocandica]
MPEKAPNQMSNSSADTIDKDIETSSTHSVPDDTDETGVDDIEAYPAGGNGTIAMKEGPMTRSSTKSSWKDPGPPPDGGLLAWWQVFLSHLVIMNTWGFINSFGVFQTYYVTALDRPPSDISWVGSMQVFLLFFVGTFTGRLTDAGYFRPVFVTGSILGVFGLFMASLSTTYWQLFLAQGVCCGLGNGFLFCPALSTLSTYFSKKRSLAIGIGAAGSATGGIVFPIMVQQLLPKVGFPWTMRALAFIQLACLLVCDIGIKTRVPPRKTGALVDWASFKELPYVLFAIGMFFTFMGVYFAFYYLGSFARDIIGVPYSESINIIIILNGVGVLGRVLPNHLADRFFGPLNTLITAVFITSMCCLCWIAVSNRAGLYAWTVAYGIGGAAIQGLFPATLSSLTTDLRKAGTRMGQVFTIVSFAVLIGPPISGQLIQLRNGGYLYAQLFGGVSLAVGFCLLVASRLARIGLLDSLKSINTPLDHCQGETLLRGLPQEDLVGRQALWAVVLHRKARYVLHRAVSDVRIGNACAALDALKACNSLGVYPPSSLAHHIPPIRTASNRRDGEHTLKMVQRATERETRAWAALPSSREMAIRRLSSVLLMGALLTVITPFTPFSWMIPSQGPELLDQFISPPLFLGALFFQWRIAGVVGNIMIHVMDVAFVYHHGMYWGLAFLEVVLCVMVNMVKNEVLRRFSAAGLVGGLWAIGWFATPQRYKQQAWEHLKWIWTMMAFNHAAGAATGRRRRF